MFAVFHIYTKVFYLYKCLSFIKWVRRNIIIVIFSDKKTKTNKIDLFCIYRVAAATAAKSLQLCQTPCDTTDSSLRLWRSPFQEAVFTYCFFRLEFTFDYPTGNLATIVKGRFWKDGIEMKAHSRFVFVIGFLFLKLGPRQP